MCRSDGASVVSDKREGGELLASWRCSARCSGRRNVKVSRRRSWRDSPDLARLLLRPLTGGKKKEKGETALRDTTDTTLSSREASSSSEVGTGFVATLKLLLPFIYTQFVVKLVVLALH